MSNSGDEFAVLGIRVKKVFIAVEKHRKAGKFRGPVVGPIGKYIKVTPGKEHFADIAELSLGASTLDRFIVTCDEDRRVLQDIRDGLGCRNDCGIFQVAVSPRYQVPDPPAAGIETVASVLSISEDLVFNSLGKFA